jgi:hypothetical protein
MKMPPKDFAEVAGIRKASAVSKGMQRVEAARANAAAADKGKMPKERA